MNYPISIAKEELESRQADAWIIVDYENRNPSVTGFLGEKMLTRKIIMAIEKAHAYIICHSIDKVFLDVPSVTDRFELRVYNNWHEMLELEKQSFSGYQKVLMDISEHGLMPRVSLADYGSVKFVEDMGIKIESSCNILQKINAAYDKESYELQLEACKKTLMIKDEAFALIGSEIKKNGKTDEYTIQQFICRRFKEEGMTYDEAPIVAIGKNASNPHYGPSNTTYSEIKEGDLVLIDMWAKMDDPKAVYADITWMAYVGDEIPEEMTKRFKVLKNAIDEGFKFIQDNFETRSVMGYEVDDVVRKVVNDNGYGQYFTHRTGHNIAVDVSPHGPGANIDNYESHDTRALIEGTSFSLEPGIYAPDFGMRSETNVAIVNNQPVIVAGRQQNIIKILLK